MSSRPRHRTRTLALALALPLALTALATACDDDDEITGPTGDLRVSVTVTGTPAAASGLRVEVDGEEFDTFGAGGGTTVARGLPPDDYEVELVDLPENCTVTGENPRDVTVTVGAVAEVVFEVGCT